MEGECEKKQYFNQNLLLTLQSESIDERFFCQGKILFSIVSVVQIERGPYTLRDP
jgi:hypothetical protein